MTTLASVLLAASTVRAAGIIIALLAVGGFIVYGLFNIRAGREEIGSEVELAANLKPHADDDTLETKVLDRSLTMGLAGLVIVGIGVPAYWLAEPARQENAVGNYQRIFENRGEGIYEEACASCHAAGGVGGVAAHTILDGDGNFVASVNWRAPALNTVLLRYDRDEVTYILNYGRSYSPMPAWGLPGGGSYTTQKVAEVIEYLASIQLSPEEARAEVEQGVRTQLGLEADATIDYGSLEVGEALFNNEIAGGAYSCARCHTRGWSIDESSAQVPAGVDPADALAPYVDYADGAGAYGPRLIDVIPRQFDEVADLADFLRIGAAVGQAYGNNGLSGDGMMPGFGDNPNTDEPDDGMMSAEMYTAIAEYVDSLHADEEVDE